MVRNCGAQRLSCARKMRLIPMVISRKHGLELQSFSEEPNLANLMILADRFRVRNGRWQRSSPMMKIGGFGRLLKRERNWDAYTRRSVGRIHRALTERAEDDVELCLKLYEAWSQASEAPHIGDSWAFRQIWPRAMFSVKPLTENGPVGAEIGKLTNSLVRVGSLDELDEIIAELEIQDDALAIWLAQVRTAFIDHSSAACAQLFFLDHRVLKTKIQTERDKLIDALSGHKKEDERRPLDFDLLTPPCAFCSHMHCPRESTT